MPVWIVGVGVIFLLLLGVNLALTAFEERLPSFLTPDRMRTLAFWGGWGLAAGAAVLGWLWTGRALEQSDRDSTRRLRSCFLFALTAVIVLAIATFDPDVARDDIPAIAAALIALAIVPFALTARALADGGHRRRRRRRSSSGDR
jgi:hypothetical protein